MNNSSTDQLILKPVFRGEIPGIRFTGNLEFLEGLFPDMEILRESVGVIFFPEIKLGDAAEYDAAQLKMFTTLSENGISVRFNP